MKTTLITLATALLVSPATAAELNLDLKGYSLGQRLPAQGFSNCTPRAGMYACIIVNQSFGHLNNARIIVGIDDPKSRKILSVIVRFPRTEVQPIYEALKTKYGAPEWQSPLEEDVSRGQRLKGALWKGANESELVLLDDETGEASVMLTNIDTMARIEADKIIKKRNAAKNL